jgi:hypothetical protein
MERARGPVWYAKFRLPDGRQVQKKLGPAWTGRGRPAAGYFTKRLAEDWRAWGRSLVIRDTRSNRRPGKGKPPRWSAPGAQRISFGR